MSATGGDLVAFVIMPEHVHLPVLPASDPVEIDIERRNRRRSLVAQGRHQWHQINGLNAFHTSQRREPAIAEPPGHGRWLQSLGL